MCESCTLSVSAKDSFRCYSGWLEFYYGNAEPYCNTPRESHCSKPHAQSWHEERSKNVLRPPLGIPLIWLDERREFLSPAFSPLYECRAEVITTHAPTTSNACETRREVYYQSSPSTLLTNELCVYQFVSVYMSCSAESAYLYRRLKRRCEFILQFSVSMSREGHLRLVVMTLGRIRRVNKAGRIGRVGRVGRARRQGKINRARQTEQGSSSWRCGAEQLFLPRKGLCLM